jgi:hypothetical protein
MAVRFERVRGRACVRWAVSFGYDRVASPALWNRSREFAQLCDKGTQSMWRRSRVLAATSWTRWIQLVRVGDTKQRKVTSGTSKVRTGIGHSRLGSRGWGNIQGYGRRAYSVQAGFESQRERLKRQAELLKQKRKITESETKRELESYAAETDRRMQRELDRLNRNRGKNLERIEKKEKAAREREKKKEEKKQRKARQREEKAAAKKTTSNKGSKEGK